MADTNGTIVVQPSPAGQTMFGSVVGEDVSANVTLPGSCTEAHTLSGTFTGPDRFFGRYDLTFTGSDCSCFGLDTCISRSVEIGMEPPPPVPALSEHQRTAAALVLALATLLFATAHRPVRGCRAD